MSTNICILKLHEMESELLEFSFSVIIFKCLFYFFIVKAKMAVFYFPGSFTSVQNM